MNDFSDIDLIINQSAEQQINLNKSILKSYLNDHTILFSLFGTDVDEYIARATWRAIQQNTTADIFTEHVFKDIFKPETKPKFKIWLIAKNELDIKKLQGQYPDKIDTEVLKQIIQSNDKKYFKAEIDGIITVGLTHPYKKNEIIFDYKNLFIEVKLFTCPIEAPKRSVIKHLRDQQLGEYFELRDILGLLSFSYLHKDEDINPVAVNTPDFKDREPPNSYGVHLVLLSKEILNDGLEAPQRIENIFEGINRHQIIMKEVNKLPDNYKYSIIYNIITVVNMSHLIAELENEVKKAREEKEKEREEKEKEREEKEKLKQILEKYKQKYGDLSE